MALGERAGSAATHSWPDDAERKAHAGGPEHDSVQRFAWYLPLGLMAALEVIDWPLTIEAGD